MSSWAEEGNTADSLCLSGQQIPPILSERDKWHSLVAEADVLHENILRMKAESAKAHPRAQQALLCGQLQHMWSTAIVPAA